MKKVVAFVGAVALGLSLASALALAKAPWKKDLGVENCAVCHKEDKKAPNPENKLWKASQEWVGKAKAAGKTCNDCHQGKLKPAK
ncbi:MAG: hypothetical protein FJ087_08965 [Deltaproteobacteria bacterium]|nr:hypothetical protein [Deltaproteobacteria bacterium]